MECGGAKQVLFWQTLSQKNKTDTRQPSPSKKRWNDAVK